MHNITVLVLKRLSVLQWFNSLGSFQLVKVNIKTNSQGIDFVDSHRLGLYALLYTVCINVSIFFPKLTGLVVQAAKRLQVNVYIEKLPAFRYVWGFFFCVCVVFFVKGRGRGARGFVLIRMCCMLTSHAICQDIVRALFLKKKKKACSQFSNQTLFWNV